MCECDQHSVSSPEAGALAAGLLAVTLDVRLRIYKVKKVRGERSEGMAYYFEATGAPGVFKAPGG